MIRYGYVMLGKAKWGEISSFDVIFGLVSHVCSDSFRYGQVNSNNIHVFRKYCIGMKKYFQKSLFLLQ